MMTAKLDGYIHLLDIIEGCERARRISDNPLEKGNLAVLVEIIYDSPDWEKTYQSLVDQFARADCREALWYACRTFADYCEDARADGILKTETEEIRQRLGWIKEVYDSGAAPELVLVGPREFPEWFFQYEEMKETLRNARHNDE